MKMDPLDAAANFAGLEKGQTIFVHFNAFL
jgi:hypothetical protein